MSRHVAAVFAALLTFHASAPAAGTQSLQNAPLPQGTRIPAQHGDIIVVENDAHLLVVRRRDAVVRAVFNRAERWVVLLADHVADGGPDGRVDWGYHYRDLSGEWPLEDRWEGPTTIEEYVIIGQGPMSRGLGFASPLGLIQFLGVPIEANVFRDRSAAAVLTYRGGGSGVGGRETFDRAEARQIANARRSTQAGAGIQTIPGGGLTSSGVRMGVAPLRPADGTGPLRVGGNVRAPEKRFDVPPVLPDAAARAGVRGVVLLEVTVAADGSVQDARVLRSIPLLDAAALEAVRQWRYAPATVQGKPVAVIMTVAVPFE